MPLTILWVLFLLPLLGLETLLALLLFSAPLYVLLWRSWITSFFLLPLLVLDLIYWVLFSRGLKALDFLDIIVLFNTDVSFPTADFILSIRFLTDFDVLESTGENVLYFEPERLFFVLTLSSRFWASFLSTLFS